MTACGVQWLVIAMSGAVAALSATVGTPAEATDLRLPTHSRVLFQGDSITDMNRGRTEDPNHILGHSYAFLIAARSGASSPGLDLTFLNRGISGNKVADLAGRWQADAIDLNPDILSILIGINDVCGGTDMDRFERDYDDLLARTRQALPKVKLVLCEPFGVEATWPHGSWDAVATRLATARAAVARLARKHGALLVPLQSVFDAAARRAPANHWTWDGIHPTYSGQQLIADQWTRMVGKEWGGRS